MVSFSSSSSSPRFGASVVHLRAASCLVALLSLLHTGSDSGDFWAYCGCLWLRMGPLMLCKGAWWDPPLRGGAIPLSLWYVLPPFAFSWVDVPFQLFSSGACGPCIGCLASVLAPAACLTVAFCVDCHGSYYSFCWGPHRLPMAWLGYGLPWTSSVVLVSSYLSLHCLGWLIGHFLVVDGPALSLWLPSVLRSSQPCSAWLSWMMFPWPRLAGGLSLGLALAPTPLHGYDCLVCCASTVVYNCAFVVEP